MTDRDRPRLSVIVPTLGRPGLERLLASIRQQAGPDVVEIVCVLDAYDLGSLGAAASLERRCFAWGATIHAHDAGYHAWGHPQRTYGQRLARGEWLLYSQDDDVYLPGAFRTLLAATAQAGPPRLFRVDTWQAGVVWRVPQLAVGNIDADCLLVPNDPDRLPVWGDQYISDFHFIAEVCALYREGPVWEEALIARGRPDQRGAP